MYSAPSNPMSDGLRTTTAHAPIHSQNLDWPQPLSRHVPVSPVSFTKYVASISVRVITPKNSHWLPNSSKSFGLGVAVQLRRYCTL